MRRFGFFMAVFCIGLVVLLVCTGQLGRLFEKKEPPQEPAEGVVETARNAQGQNKITFHSLDINEGRERFVITAVAERGFSVNPQELYREQSYTDAELEIPIHAVEPAPGQLAAPIKSLKLLAARLDVESVEQKTWRVRLSQGVTAEGDNGARFSAQDLAIDWLGSTAPDKQRLCEFRTQKPVLFSYPLVRMHGEGGLEGEYAGGTGATTITFLPPVVVAVDRSSAGGALGFPPDGKTPATGGNDVVILYSEKSPLVVDQKSESARFTGEVLIYPARVSPNTPLYPAPNIEQMSLSCPDLSLLFDGKLMRIRQAATSVGEDLAVRAFFFEKCALTGSRLSWDENAQVLMIDGGVHLEGTLGEFRAARVRIYPLLDLFVLEEGVSADLFYRDPHAERAAVPEHWQLEADRIEFEYEAGGGSGAQPLGNLRRMEAIAAYPRVVSVVTRDPFELKLTAGRVLYMKETEYFQLFPPADHPAERPRLEQGENLVAADRIALSIAPPNPRTLFQGGVNCRVYLIPQREGKELPDWVPQGREGEYADIRAGELELMFGSAGKRGMKAPVIEEIDARQGDAAEPARLENVGLVEHSFQVSGERIRYRALSQEISIEGSAGTQRLFFSDTEVLAGTIYYAKETQAVRADHQVKIRSWIARANENRAEPAAADPVQIFCDHLECKILENSAANAATAAPQPQLYSVRAWAEEGNRVRGEFVRDGSYVAEGDEITWLAEDGIVRVEGANRQRLACKGKTGEHVVTANSIQFSPSANWVKLSGAFEALLNLDEIENDGAPAAAFSIWKMQGGTAFIQFPPASFGKDQNELKVPAEILVEDRVTLSNEAERIYVEGSTCSWSSKDRRLRVFSQEAKGRQTFSWAKPGNAAHLRDEIIAREVSIALDPANRDLLSVFFEDVPEALIHMRREDPMVPSEFRLRTDHMLLLCRVPALKNLPVDRPGAGAAVKDKKKPDGSNQREEERIVEALAWGRLIFEGGTYRVIAQRCIYKDGEQTGVFFGDPRDPVRLSVQGHDMTPGEVVTLKKNGSGYEVETKGRYAWNSDDIRAFLEYHKSVDKAPKDQERD